MVGETHSIYELPILSLLVVCMVIFCDYHIRFLIFLLLQIQKKYDK
jgi:hypothetical protein